MKLISTVKKIEFPTNANGVVACLLRLEPTPELTAMQCGGIGFGIGTHITQDSKLPFKIGSTVEITFSEKGEITKHRIVNNTKGFTRLPKTCVSCEAELRAIKNRSIVEALMCPNTLNCVAQSNSPIHRLAFVASDFKVNTDNTGIFIWKYPDGALEHLSDLKIFLSSDPNTATRENMWEFGVGWEIEKNVWNYLNKKELPITDFWYIGFNINHEVCPREVLRDFNKDYAVPDIIRNNIDRVSDLIKFLDNWVEKTYVTEDDQEE